MRTGIHFTVTSGDRQRLQAIVADPKSAQKHLWRARIILKTDAGLGTSAIMRATGKSKTCVWRWQERFMHEGVNGLLRDKSRPPGKAPIAVDGATRKRAAAPRADRPPVTASTTRRRRSFP